MAITDEITIRYTNEVIRPMAEKIRALKAEIDSHMLQWHGGIGAVCNADLNGTIEDGRESEGVTRLTGNDATLLINQMIAIQTLLDGVGVMNVIVKPCVNPLRVA